MVAKEEKKENKHAKRHYINRKSIWNIFKTPLFSIFHLCFNILGFSYQLLSKYLPNLELANENACRPDNELPVL
jgi:hypothetical protein